MIEVNNLTKTVISETHLKRVALYVLEREGKKDKGLSIALVSSKRSQELNKIYRGKDEEANVLSFAQEEFGLGELVISPVVVRKDAKKYDILFTSAMTWMVIHGILHLLGYTHKTMEKKEEIYRAHFQ
ncbi:MAG: rRNA maturation RNase YbeY [Patescibacteria group bacterium]|nr:rRNA maturation RNase YbeY [Patescibacteria group bacterium]